MIHESWKPFLKQEFSKEYFKSLSDFTLSERTKYEVYPKHEDVLNAFSTDFNGIKVVILGQDPYHNSHQAHGYSFSVPKGITVPPSLRNIYKELESDIGVKPPDHGDLRCWAERGVFLLNTVLTVRANSPASHQGYGWETFTDSVIHKLNEKEFVVYILWGKQAQSKRFIIDEPKHRVIASAHPSPFSAHTGFFGSKPFSKANKMLSEYGLTPIDWTIDS